MVKLQDGVQVRMKLHAVDVFSFGQKTIASFCGGRDDGGSDDGGSDDGGGDDGGSDDGGGDDVGGDDGGSDDVGGDGCGGNDNGGDGKQKRRFITERISQIGSGEKDLSLRAACWKLEMPFGCPVEF